VLVLAAAALVVVGAVLLVVGVLGWRGALRRNRFVGVRTAATMGSEDAFRVGNRVAGPAVCGAGTVAVLGGVAGWAAPSATAGWTVFGIAAVGTLALLVAGGVVGSAAAARQAHTEPAACAGCACGGGGCLAAQSTQNKGR
jgi:uncharacterized membrane protein